MVRMAQSAEIAEIVGAAQVDRHDVVDAGRGVRASGNLADEPLPPDLLRAFRPGR